MYEAFQVRDGVMCCEGLPLDELGREFGTPLYVYSAPAILDRLAGLNRAISPVGGEVFFAVKANSNISLLRLMVGHGAGLEVVSVVNFLDSMIGDLSVAVEMSCQ